MIYMTFLGGVLGVLPLFFLKKKAQNPPLKKSYRSYFRRAQIGWVIWRSSYELFFPLEGPGSHRCGNPRKMGKNYKIPLPGPTPENGEKLHKNYKNCIFGVILPFFGGNFPHFRGSDRGGEFCNFSPFFGDFRPGGFPSPLRGKTTRNARLKIGPRSGFWIRRSAFLYPRSGFMGSRE